MADFNLQKMGDEIFKKIIDFVSDKAGVDPNRIERTTRLELDLGVYGDDAEELIIGYSKRFNVDVSQFMLSDYFNGESDPLTLLLCWLFRAKSSKKDLTVGHVEKGVIAGRLDAEVINGDKTPHA